MNENNIMPILDSLSRLYRSEIITKEEKDELAKRVRLCRIGQDDFRELAKTLDALRERCQTSISKKILNSAICSCLERR